MVILLNGPSSSGKSSISQALKELLLQHQKTYEIVSIDDFMKLDPKETIYEDDVYEISLDMCKYALDKLEKCNGVIIDHVITSERIYKQLLDELKGHDIYLVHITCPLDILKQREESRGNRCIGSAEASFTYLYPKDDYHLTLDSGILTSEECALKIYQSIAS